MTGLRQWWCALRGHDEMLQFERERMLLKCASCGHESTGWALTDAPPPITARVERRKKLGRPSLIGSRRLA